MSGKVNMYNMWQKFCASVNIPKDQVKTLYDVNKNEIKSTNPSLWYDFIKKTIHPMVKIQMMFHYLNMKMIC